MIQRLSDWLRERRIEALQKASLKAYADGRKFEFNQLHGEMCAEVMARSPQQIARMEKRKGLEA